MSELSCFFFPSPLLFHTVSGDAFGSLKVNLSISCPLNNPPNVEEAGKGPAAFPLKSSQIIMRV